MPDEEEFIEGEGEGEEGAEDESEEEESEDSQEEKTSKEGEIEDKGEEKKGKEKSRRSVIAQKKHWREKAQKTSARVTELEAELAAAKEGVKKPTDEKEAAAQEYIRGQARKVFEELQKEREKAEAKEEAEFGEKVDAILDDNPDVAEEELLDTIEEYEVPPETALRILKRQSKSKEKEKGGKPKMPQSKGGTPEKKKEAPDDSKKSIWEIAREESQKAKS